MIFIHDNTKDRLSAILYLEQGLPFLFFNFDVCLSGGCP
jgi:hypothetical protein